MATIRNLHAFDKGWASHLGSPVTIQINDKINSIAMNIVHIPASSETNFGFTISASESRLVKGAIWVVNDNWTISKYPDHYSVKWECDGKSGTGFFNPNSLQEGKSATVKFYFNTGKIYARTVIIGLYSDATANADKGSIAYIESSSPSTLYYSHDYLNMPGIEGEALQSADGIDVFNVDVTSDTQADQDVDIKIKNIVSRTLSQIDVRNGKDYPKPDADAQRIKNTGNVNRQWNTDPNTFEGFDIPEGRLKDVTYGYGSTAQTVPNSSSTPFWAHTRSRIKFTIAPPPNGISYIRYEVAGAFDSDSTTTAFRELPNQNNTLIICPRDEGIESTEPMTVTLYRELRSTNGKVIKRSDPVTFYFEMYSVPRVNIAYPKNLPNGAPFELWANDILNNQFEESREIGQQICNALPLMLTKDGGDNSGLPILTRIHVQEVPDQSTDGTYVGRTASIQELINSQEKLRNQRVAYWTGIQLDDGTLLQLSGTAADGFVWDWVKEDDTGKTDIDYYKNLDDLPYHKVAVGKNDSGEVLWQKDRRMLFRAGFKYIVSVRRFHAAVAGGISQYTSKSEGTYIYDEKSNYPGAPAFAVGKFTAGNDGKHYPVEDSQEWLLSQSRGLDITSEDNYTSSEDYTVNHNNYSKIEKWVGPADGTAGHINSLSDANQNKTYPGFAEVSYIGLRCVSVMSSSKNIVVPRPAIQEFNANGWIAFAYRHLNKNMMGLDYYIYKGKGGALALGQPSTYTIKDDTLVAIPGEENIGQAWAGGDNTADRLYKMYKLIVDRSINLVKTIPESYTRTQSNLENQVNKYVSDNVTESANAYFEANTPNKDNATFDSVTDIAISYNVKGTRISIGVKCTSPYPEIDLTEQGYSDILDSDNATNTDKKILILYDYNEHNYASAPMNAVADGYKQFLDPNSTTEDKITRIERMLFGAEGSHDSLKDSYTVNPTSGDEEPNPSDAVRRGVAGCPYGNSYSWHCVYNAVDGDQKNLKVSGENAKDFAYFAGNWGKFLGDSFESARTNSEQLLIDTHHQVSDTNMQTDNEDPNTTAKISSSNWKTMQEFKWNANKANQADFSPEEIGNASWRPCKEYAGTHQDAADPTAPQNNAGAGYLYTRRGDIDIKKSDIENNVTKLLDGYGQQYHKGKQLYNADGAQLSTGELWKRTPVNQDCENGTPQKIRRAVSATKNPEQPLVRTSHLLYFTTTALGDIVYRLEVAFEVTCTIKYSYTVKKTDDNGKPYTKTEYSTISRCKLKSPSKDATTWKHVYQFSDQTNWGNTHPYNAEIPFLNEVGEYIPDATDKDQPKNRKILRVFGEDNGGFGRCLSADDETAGWWDGEGKVHGINSKDSMDGAIEYPIKVRYTPLTQPVNVSGDWNIMSDNQNEVSSLAHNIISVTRRPVNCNKTTYVTRAENSPNWIDNLNYAEQFYANIAYPMFRSMMNQKYFSVIEEDMKNTGSVNHFSYQRLYQSNINMPPLVKGKGLHSSKLVNQDTYPGVGICTSFLVLLIPSDGVNNNSAKLDYTKQAANWFSKENNYTQIKVNGMNAARTFVVCNLDATTCMEDLSASNACSEDFKLRTSLSQQFNFERLLFTGDKNKSKIQASIWYDLVVVPVFKATQYDQAVYNGNSDTAGNVHGKIPGGGRNDAKSETTYYGSTPLVVDKYLKFAEVRTSNKPIVKKNNGTWEEIFCGGGGGDKPEPDYNPSLDRWLSPTILFPNVNNVRFNTESGAVKECPGFWLNNTFRVILRGPHYRAQEQIAKNPGPAGEISLEAATGNKLRGAEQCKNFQITDIQIHIGKYTENVTYTDDNGNDVTVPFNSTAFQKLLNNNAMNTQWISKYQVYSMRTHPEAFSKCCPERKNVYDDDRDIIKGGGICPSAAKNVVNSDTTYTSDNSYSDRLFEFNPAIVNATTKYSEGYYIQFRVLNGEYLSGSQGGTWSEWYGSRYDDMNPDSNLQYCVPVRNYNDIETAFRSYIKESYPGANVAINNIASEFVAGSGTESRAFDVDGKSKSIQGVGNAAGTPTLPSEAIKVPEFFKQWSDDSDLPYFPQIWGNLSEEAGNAQYPITDDIKKRHQTMWEMCYVDYIIRNMAKLYYSDWVGAYVNDNNRIACEDWGWTKSLALAFKQAVLDNAKTNDWYDVSETTIKDRYAGTVNTINNTSGIVGTDNQDSAPVNNLDINNMPYNRNRYFRKPISKDDFDVLQGIISKLVSFIRDTKFTGKHTELNDSKDGNNKSNGLYVLPIEASLLEFDRYTAPSGSSRQVIGHSLQPNQPGIGTDNNSLYTQTDSNYIKQLMTEILAKIIQSPQPSILRSLNDVVGE